MTTETQLLRKAAQRLIAAAETAAKHFGYARLGGVSLEDSNVRCELHAGVADLRAALTQPAKPASHVPEADFGNTPPASQEQMSNGLTEAETNATASVMGLTASQEQAQQPSGGEVVAWTESKPKKPGVYGWRGSPASYDMVHVHTRPTEHSPGGQLNGSCLSGKGFYHGCAITSWGGEWIGPLDTLTLATPKPDPMTDEQLCEALGIDGSDDWTYEVRDAVERHHGITKGEA